MKLLILLLLYSINIYAEDATVFYSKGYVVSIDSEGHEKKVKIGDSFIEGETLKTGENSFAILKIGEHSTHRVEEKTEITIEKLPYEYEDSTELQQGGSVFLKLGTIFSEIYKKSANDSFEIKTRNTTMGVRGTKLMASIDEYSHDTWLSVNEGTVEVDNAISNEKDIVIKNQSMIIEKDKTFTRQQKYDWQKNLKWNIEKNKENFKYFRKQRKIAYQEFRQRRSSWTRNEIRWSEFKNNRKEKLQRFKNRIKNLKENKSLIKRKELRKKKQASFKAKKVKRSRQKKSFYKKGMLDKNQEIETNSFINKRRNQQKILQNKTQRLQNFRQKRREQRQIRPRRKR